MTRFTGFIFLTASLLVGACSEHDYIYGQITQHNGKYTGHRIDR